MNPAAYHLRPPSDLSRFSRPALASPYINHPIEVAKILATIGEVTDLSTLIAAVLHDTAEDTNTTFPELERLFGKEVRLLVEEMTDDKKLPKEERKASRFPMRGACRKGPSKSKLRIRSATFLTLPITPCKLAPLIWRTLFTSELVNLFDAVSEAFFRAKMDFFNREIMRSSA